MILFEFIIFYSSKKIILLLSVKSFSIELKIFNFCFYKNLQIQTFKINTLKLLIIKLIKLLKKII